MEPSSITERLPAAAWARDLLGVSGCKDSEHCRLLVETFRSSLRQKESQKLYRGFTAQRLATLDEQAFRLRHYSIATVDLDRYGDPDQLLEDARERTSKKGRVNREVGRAQRLGYSARFFDARLHAPDMFDVHTSKSVRGGKQLKQPYRASVEEIRADPNTSDDTVCPIHQRSFWGVFRDEPGHRQEEVITGARLVAYLYLIRRGNHTFYGRIMGHGDHLRHGVMYLLHFSFLQRQMTEERHGPRFVFYNAFHSGPKDGSLTTWKHRCLFEPRYLLYAEPEAPLWFEEAERLPTLSRRWAPSPKHSERGPAAGSAVR